MKHLILLCLALVAFKAQADVSVLCYHRFGPNVSDGTSITPEKFEKQLVYLTTHGFTFVSLEDAVQWNKGLKKLPEKSVVITVDDGHETVYSTYYPIIKKYKIPTTLFIYPSAISNKHAPYAMKWEQISDLMKTGLFTVQSHTYWHPNFKTEKKRLSAVEYEKFVKFQLEKSKQTLEEKLGIKVSYIAWPFGIHDEQLEKLVEGAGYTAAFALGEKNAKTTDGVFRIPRFMITQGSDITILDKK